MPKMSQLVSGRAEIHMQEAMLLSTRAQIQPVQETPDGAQTCANLHCAFGKSPYLFRPQFLPLQSRQFGPHGPCVSWPPSSPAVLPPWHSHLIPVLGVKIVEQSSRLASCLQGGGRHSPRPRSPAAERAPEVDPGQAAAVARPPVM